MQLEGIHHVTCITANARENLAFYTGVLGLRLVAKSVNQDDPTVYHLFYSDETGRPGAEVTFFEYPGAPPGRAGAGMVHTVVWRVAGESALDFWERRLRDHAVVTERDAGRLAFADPESLRHELVVRAVPDEPLTALHPAIPAGMALQGFDGVRAFSADPAASARLLEQVMGARRVGESRWEIRGEHRGGIIAHDPAPDARGTPGAGTVHHVAWGTTVAEHPRWLQHLLEHHVHSTPVVDRHYFHSIYFREPGGVLFEIADDGPGFTIDSPAAELGQRIILPPRFEPQRARIEAALTPLPDPRAAWSRTPDG